MENTEKIINERVEEFRQKLIKEFVKPKFEVGKWYKVPDSILINYQGNRKENEYTAYGFSSTKMWHNTSSFGGYKDLIPATESEVKDALIKEAVKRGFVEGVNISNVKTLNSNGDYIQLSGEISKNWNFDISKNALSNYGCWFFRNGKWAEIIPQPKTIDDWAKDYYEFRDSFKGSTAEAFKQFITENNFQLPK